MKWIESKTVKINKHLMQKQEKVVERITVIFIYLFVFTEHKMF